MDGEPYIRYDFSDPDPAEVTKKLPWRWYQTQCWQRLLSFLFRGR